MADASTIDCALMIEWLNKQQSVTKTGKWKSSTLSLIRNEFREIYLQAKVSAAILKFRLENVNVHKKFISEGKATITFHAHPAVLYISNAPASQLLLFLKTIFIKMSSSKSSPKVPLREQLLSNKNRVVQEISPINTKDIKRVSIAKETSATIQAGALKRKSVSEKQNVQALSTTPPAGSQIEPAIRSTDESIA
ncbi:DNA helicase [Homalodisca vitripennis]|nr:DNA helicase [Homalodisca vitripennis]